MWVAPAFVYLALFIAYPFVMSLYLSLSSARVGSPEWHFVGFTNFQRIFEDPTFWQTVRNSFIFTFGSEILLDLRVSGSTVVARVEPTVRVKVHETIKLAVNAERLRFFDVKTEQAI